MVAGFLVAQFAGHVFTFPQFPLGGKTIILIKLRPLYYIRETVSGNLPPQCRQFKGRKEITIVVLPLFSSANIHYRYPPHGRSARDVNLAWIGRVIRSPFFYFPEVTEETQVPFCKAAIHIDPMLAVFRSVSWDVRDSRDHVFFDGLSSPQ